MPLDPYSAAISGVLGLATTAAAGPNTSGAAGNLSTGGIIVGSKVVGSGSASTSVPNLDANSIGPPPVYTQADGTHSTGTNLIALLNQYAPIAAAVIGLIGLLFLIQGRKSK